MKSAQYWIVGLVIVILILAGFVWHLNGELPAAKPGSQGDTQGQVSDTGQNTSSNSTSGQPAKPATGSTGSTGASGTLGTYPIHILPSGPAVYYSSASVADRIKVSNPPTNTIIQSPLTITGTAVGPWYFEASFPVILTNASGKILARTNAAALSDWMTSDFVPFSGKMSFPLQKSGSKGVLILKKDNPSGLPQNEASLEIQVTFQ